MNKIAKAFGNKVSLIISGIACLTSGATSITATTTYTTAFLGLIKTGAVTVLSITPMGILYVVAGSTALGLAALPSDKVAEAISQLSEAIPAAAAAAATAAVNAAAAANEKKD